MATRKAKAAQTALNAPAPIMTQAQMDAASAGLVTPQNDVNNAGLWQNPLANDPAYMLAYGGALGPNPGDARYVPRGPTAGYQLTEIPSSLPRTATPGVPSLGQAPSAPGTSPQAALPDRLAAYAAYSQHRSANTLTPEDIALYGRPGYVPNPNDYNAMVGATPGQPLTSPISIPNPGLPGSNVGDPTIPASMTQTATNAPSAAALPNFMNIEQDPVGSIYDTIKKANNQAQLPSGFQSSWGG